MKYLKSMVVFLLIFISIPTLHAATQPIFTITSQSSPRINLTTQVMTTIDYLVTNETNYTRTLTMVPIQGITPVTTDEGLCGNPFILAEKKSCILRLLIAGDAINNEVVGGPRICKTQSDNNTPDPFLCAQPSKQDRLNISIAPAPLIYVSDIKTDRMTHCNLRQDGSLINCEINIQLSAGADPEGIVLNKSNTLIYYNDKALDAIFMCDIMPKTGALVGCRNSGAHGSALSDNTQNLVFNPVLSTVMYAIEFTHTLSTCPVNADGTMGLCTDVTPTYGSENTPVNALLNIGLNSSATRAYLANRDFPTAILVCDVNTETGILSFPCENSGADNLGSRAASIQITADGTKAYITGQDTVTTCDVSNADGTLSSCQPVDGALGQSANSALNSAETKLYVTQNNAVSTLNICSIDASTRLITGCEPKTDSIWDSTSGIALFE